jgi:hypothetical protein
MADKTRFPAGKHEAEIVEQGITTASTGTLALFVVVEIDGYDTRQTIRLYVTPKTEEYVAKKLAVMGFDGDSIDQFDPEHPRHISVVGKRIPVKNKHESGTDGNTYDKFDVMTPFDREKASPAQVRAAGEGLNKHLRAQKAAAPKQAVAPSSDITDDDVPF